MSSVQPQIGRASCRERVYLLFCVSKWGWGFDKYLAEANRGDPAPKKKAPDRGDR